MRLFRPRQFPRETEDPDYRRTNKKDPRIAEALTTVETGVTFADVIRITIRKRRG